MIPPLNPSPCPAEGGRFVRIVSPKVGSPVSGVLWSARPLGFWTHFVCGQTHPCLGDSPACIGHAEGVPRRWKAYLVGRSDQLGMRCVFEVPKESFRLSASLQDPGVNLRGSIIRLTRVGPNNNSPVRVDLRTEARMHGVPDTEPDTLAIMCKIWGCADPRDVLLNTEGGHDD